MSKGKLKAPQEKQKVLVLQPKFDKLNNKSGMRVKWKVTKHHIDSSSFLCAETEKTFHVRWNAKNGSILEKTVPKHYLIKELGNYEFEEDMFRWCAALNVVDDERVPAQQQNR